MNTKDSNVNVLAPADGWIPTGGRRPEGLIEGCRVDKRWKSGIREILGEPENIRSWLDCTFYRLAQPAAQECNCGAIPELESHLSSCATRAAGPSDAEPECNCGGANDRGEHGVCCNITLGIVKADQRESAAGKSPSVHDIAQSGTTQSDSHPYRSRNGYGLRIREADVRERVVLAISRDVFRRMK